MNPDQIAEMLKHGVEVEHEKMVFEAKIRGCEVKNPRRNADPVKMTNKDQKKFDSIINKITQSKLREIRGAGR